MKSEPTATTFIKIHITMYYPDGSVTRTVRRWLEKSNLCDKISRIRCMCMRMGATKFKIEFVRSGVETGTQTLPRKEKAKTCRLENRR